MIKITVIPMDSSQLDRGEEVLVEVPSQCSVGDKVTWDGGYGEIVRSSKARGPWWYIKKKS